MIEGSNSNRGHQASERVKVIYLVGAARSGTSLLTSLLGELHGVFAAAEMRLLWKGYDTRLCGCGAPVSDCSIWSKAVAAARAVSSLQAPDDFIRLQLASARNRHLPKVIGSSPTAAARAYLEVMESMYTTLAEASGSRIIVDSSKSAAEAALLRFGASTLTYPIHVVRDPRAVAYSWERAGRRRPKNRQSALKSAAGWCAANVAAEVALQSHPSDRRIRVRYEDYVTEPTAELTRLASLVGLPPGDLSFLTQRGAARASRHMVGGNALRFEADVVKLEPDTEWLDRLSTSRSALVTTVTLPLLARYGYQVVPGWDPEKADDPASIQP